jgi:hypothetical protein
MASRDTTNTSVDASVEEARRLGASAEEALKVHHIVNANTAPEIVRSFEVEFGSDSANNPAVWVHLIVDPDLNPSREKISELNGIARKVRFALLDGGFAFWPYVDFRGRP